MVFFQYAFLKNQAAYRTVTITLHLKAGTQSIDGLDTDAVQSHAFLKSLGIVFASSIEHRDRLNEFALRNATSVVPYRYAQIVDNIHFNAISGMHLKLIDGVVDDLLQKHIHAVFRQRAVAQAPDIHTGTCAYMLHVTEMAYVIISVSHCGLFLRTVVIIFIFRHLVIDRMRG